tara:strand:- start:146 stop:604 length:459 start_codon:yes stop_codon:yes gene_type:complete
MANDILTKALAKKLVKNLASRSSAYDFGRKSFRCHSVVSQTGRLDCLKLVDVLVASLVPAVNILEHPPVMIDNYVKSCQHQFNSRWNLKSSIDVFLLRNDNFQIALTKANIGMQKSLMIFVQDNNYNSAFFELCDTLATDRIWFLANKFQKK